MRLHSIRARIHRPSERGQVLLMFAVLLTVLLGIVGLAMDGGIAFAQRRTMQNAADAGALAGARMVAKWTAGAPTTALGEVTSVVRSNSMGSATPVVTECVYVNDAKASVGSCGATVPAAATGVRVTVAETHPTYFIRVLPGGVDSVTTSATATANVERYKARGDGPFIVCGVDTMLGGGGKGKGKGNGTLSVLLNNTAQLNPEAIGETFKIHGPQIADCDMKSNSFKGLADQEANAGLPVGTWWDGDTGVKAGPTRVEVNGIQGCAQATTAPNDCIMLLPVAANPPKAEKKGSTPKFFIVRLAAFMVTRVSANEHYGTLLDDYMVSGPSEPGWCRDCGGVVVVRLTE